MAIDKLHWLADVLREEGLSVEEFDGWREHGDGALDDVWGIMCHHTGSDKVSADSIADGTVDRAGPLSNVLIHRDGTVTVVAAGMANHAGGGYHPDLPRNNANGHTIGIHAVLGDKQQYPHEQYQSYVRCCAAIVRKIGKPASHVIGHSEWDPDKTDPNLSMDQLRADVRLHLGSRPQPNARQFQ